MAVSDHYWPADPHVLWARPLEFWPTADQTVEERRNSVARLVLYCAVLATLFARSWRWLAYGIAVVLVLTLAGTAVSDVRRVCQAPTPVNFSMNPPRYTVPGAGWQAGRHAACRYDTRGALARKVVEARTRGLPKGADVSPYYTVAGAASHDNTGDFLEFAYGDWLRPTCKQDQATC